MFNQKGKLPKAHQVIIALLCKNRAEVRSSYLVVI